jgi:hypothetical protein
VIFGRREIFRELVIDAQDIDADQMDRELDDAVAALAARGVELDVSIPGLFTTGSERLLQFRAGDEAEVVAELERRGLMVEDDEEDETDEERWTDDIVRPQVDPDAEYVELDLDEVRVVDVEILGAQLAMDGIDVGVYSDAHDERSIRPCRIVYPMSDEDAVLDALAEAGLISEFDRDRL